MLLFVVTALSSSTVIVTPAKDVMFCLGLFISLSVYSKPNVGGPVCTCMMALMTIRGDSISGDSFDNNDQQLAISNNVCKAIYSEKVKCNCYYGTGSETYTSFHRKYC